MGGSLDSRPAGANRPHPSTRHLILRAPPAPVALAAIVGLSVAMSLILWAPDWTTFSLALVLVFLVPALLAGVVTPPLALVLGGRFELQRSLFLVLMVLLIELPIAIVGRVGLWLVPSFSAGVWAVVLFLQGPALWFRHLSLYGVSTAQHSRSIVPALVQPLLAVLGVFVLVPPTVPLLAAAFAFLVLAFLCAFILLRAVDRPLKRGFQSSGISMMRPLIDHVDRRDPVATEKIESFFLKSTQPTDLRVTLFGFWGDSGARATFALPTVHPGPFGAIGASDLPRKLGEALGPAAGTVFVPHTPCDHDLDLPSEAELRKVSRVCGELLDRLSTQKGSTRASPLVAPRPGSLARAQIVGDVALVLVTQAPAPTDDISFAIADRIVREAQTEGGPLVALIDAHNSYIEDQGDVVYGTPVADRLVQDAKDAIRAAQAQAVEGRIEVGTAVLRGYDIGTDGIAAEGIRALTIRAAGQTTAYILIDGNNLVHGLREPVLAQVLKHVDAAEVMTTDNHVVHETDGSINAVGERYPVSDLAVDVERVVTAALTDLTPVVVRAGVAPVRDVLTLTPGFTQRLLTAISDTVSMLGNALLLTMLLLLASSLVVVLALG